MFSPIGFYANNASGSTSAYYTPDIWSLTYTNTVVGSYSKNSTTNPIGKYYRGPGDLYVSEALLKSSAMVTALSGKTVLDFQIEYTVSVNSIFTSTNAPVAVFKCDVNWTDTPTTQPTFNVPFDAATAWATNLVTDSLTWTPTTPLGTYTISKSTAQTNLVQGWANGTDANNGVILAMDNQYFGSTITISGTRFWVSYQ